MMPDIARTEGDACDRPMEGNLHGHKVQWQLQRRPSRAAYNPRPEENLRPVWDGLQVVREMPPVDYVVRHGKQRTHCECKHCRDRDLCGENVQRGGACLCELVVVVQAGAREVML